LNFSLSWVLIFNKLFGDMSIILDSYYAHQANFVGFKSDYIKTVNV